MGGSRATLLRYPEAGLVAVIGMAVLTFTLIRDTFWSVDTAEAVLRAVAVVGLIAIGEALLLLTGELDLSVGSVASLAAVAGCQVVVGGGLPWVTGVVVAVAVGAAVGLVNAFLVVRVGLPALIVTLGTLYGAGGLALVVTDGLPIDNLPAGLLELGREEVLGLPLPVWLLLVAVAGTQFMLSKTAYGRSLYAIGGSARAALRAGVPVARYKVYAFVTSGVLAGLAGLLLAGRIGTAAPTLGQGNELAAVTAAAVGGVSLFGGVGTVVGAFLGAVFIQIVNIGLVIAGLESTLQPVATGVLLLAAVALDRVRRLFIGG